jgi:hypothetical protein
VDGFDFVFLPFVHSGNLICHINGGGLSSMGGKQKPIIEQTRYDKNRIAFVAIENEWHTVRIGYIRELTGEGKTELERIYSEELDHNWLPNRYCKGCYFKAVEELIHHFNL